MKPSQISIIAQIRQLLVDIVRGDGQISGSVYDTAQLLRWAPSPDPLPALHWLLAEQQADGGWGNPHLTYHRQQATLAAILALHQYRHRLPQAAEAAEAGSAFLRLNKQIWEELHDDLPVGAELIIPTLFAQATAQGILLPGRPYEGLHNLGIRRQLLIKQLQPGAATTASHCWEAWGTEPRPEFIDQTGSVGHSPAATAAWLHTAQNNRGLHAQQEQAQIYLAQAARATKNEAPGVVPTVWPNQGFEVIFGLFALHLAGLLEHESLRDLIKPMLYSLAQQIEFHGTSFSPFFTPDGDDTATAMIVLHAGGYSIHPSLITPFMRKDHFVTWENEIYRSLSTTAHAIHALSLISHPITTVVQDFISQQHSDGYWYRDKWHTSPYYITSQALLALHTAGQEEATQEAVAWFLTQQRYDGGWGMHYSTKIETAYVVLALHFRGLQTQIRKAIGRASRILRGAEPYRPSHWVAKVLYTPCHVDKLFELSAAWVVTNMDEDVL